MKTAVIICLFSLSLCFSEATQPVPPTDVHNATVDTAPKDSKVTEKVDKTEIIVVTTETPSPAPTSKKNSDVSTLGAQPDKKTTEAKSEVKNPEDKKEIDQKAADNKTDGNKTETAPKPTVKPVKPEESPVPAKENGTKPAGGKDEPSTTHATVTEKSTEAPKQPSSEAPVIAAARGFDGPSFMGGIVLTLGLLAIGFMGFKYYKNQTERNYHTL